MKTLVFFLLLIFVYSAPKCSPGINFCSKCNTLTDLCVKCTNPEVFTPDKNGGCTGSKKCKIGLNYCDECDEDKALCTTCNSAFFPDENGGCSYDPNCMISYLGECIQCKDDFFFVKDKKLCKSENSDDFINCKTIDSVTGFCFECKNGFYLNSEDKRCTEIENCSKSIYGKCISCNDKYYLDHNDKQTCKPQAKKESLMYCKETEDGKTCSKCESEYYSDSEGGCVSTNFCSIANETGNVCKECIEDYYLTQKNSICVSTDNCSQGDKDTGICLYCNNKFCFDSSDGQCISNVEDDDYKYCINFKDGNCQKCLANYFVAEDGKCTNTRNCSISEFGICKKCQKGFHSDKNQRCTDIEHCIEITDYSTTCEECEEDYVYDYLNKTCIEATEDNHLLNCKTTTPSDSEICYKCKEGFYLNLTDYLCYPNDDIESPLYKCAQVSTSEGKALCRWCEKDYFLADNRKCSTTESCSVAEEGECKECVENRCLDLATKTCKQNKYISKEEDKVYYNCKVTNTEGTKCKACIDGLTPNENGLCTNEEICEDVNDDGECVECKKSDEDFPYYCLNKDFGCISNYFNKNCLRCDNILDISNCTKCEKGYKLVENPDFEERFICEPVD